MLNKDYTTLLAEAHVVTGCCGAGERTRPRVLFPVPSPETFIRTKVIFWSLESLYC